MAAEKQCFQWSVVRDLSCMLLSDLPVAAGYQRHVSGPDSELAVQMSPLLTSPKKWRVQFFRAMLIHLIYEVDMAAS